METRQRSFLTFREAAQYARVTAIKECVEVPLYLRPDGWWVVVLPREVHLTNDEEFELKTMPVVQNEDIGRAEDVDYDHDDGIRRVVQNEDDGGAEDVDDDHDDGGDGYEDEYMNLNDDWDDERAQRIAESEDYADSMARSEEDGWFYED